MADDEISDAQALRHPGITDVHEALGLCVDAMNAELVTASFAALRMQSSASLHEDHTVHFRFRYDAEEPIATRAFTLLQRPCSHSERSTR